MGNPQTVVECLETFYDLDSETQSDLLAYEYVRQAEEIVLAGSF